MKAPYFTAALCLALSAALLTTTGCKKDNATGGDDTFAALEDVGQAEQISSDIDNIMNAAAANADNSSERLDDVDQFGLRTCATVIRDSVNRTITVDFGTGCTGRDGRYRSGQILIQYSGGYFTPGSAWTMSFNHFFVDGRRVEGSRTVTNTGLNSAGNMTWSVEARQMKITLPDGRWKSWDSQRSREMVAGYGDSTCVNDAYLVNGNSNGSNDRGESFTATFTNLYRAHSCRWVSSGIIELSGSNRPVRTLDFGSGGCDDEATLTVNGQSRIIHLR